jgi:Kef-type K+ transport system membrane component KefB
MTALHVLLALVAVLGLALAARAAARACCQPEVVGEVVAGLAIGPVLLVLGGRPLLEAALPAAVLDVLKPIGHLALVLFLVGVAHELRGTRFRPGADLVGRAALGSFLVPLAAGLAFALWVLQDGSAALRGEAPRPAFLVMVSVTLAVTAVPVLARMLAGIGMSGSPIGSLSLSAAVVTDTAAWMLLAVAIALNTGTLRGALLTALMLVLAAVVALAARLLMGLGPVDRFAAARPTVVALVLAAGAVALCQVLEGGGLTAVLGAFAVGLAVPRGEAADLVWSPVVQRISRTGLLLVPVFFVVTGATLLTRLTNGIPWTACVLAVTLGVVGKVLGTFLATVGPLPVQQAMQLGVLMNTRGLTEIVLLQAGLAAGILTPELFVALMVMAVVTTVLTGPLLSGLSALGGDRVYGTAGPVTKAAA